MYVPFFHPTPYSLIQVQNHDFDGCMRNVEIDGEQLDLNDNVWNNGTEAGCNRKKDFCRNKPCQHGGTCIEAWGRYRCECPEGRGGMDCSHGKKKFNLCVTCSNMTNFKGIFDTINPYSAEFLKIY